MKAKGIWQLVAAWMGFLLAASCAFAAVDYFDVEEFLKALNSPPLQQEMGVKEVIRPANVLNRLDVAFQEDTASDKRQRVLSDIGQDFFRLLFKETQVTSVTVREQNAHGETLNQVIVNLEGAPKAPAASAPMVMGKGD